MKWDGWIGKSDNGPVVLWYKNLLHIKRWGFKIDLHKIVEADDPGCFHTHPAKAIRIVLWGGYIEEVREETHYVCTDGTGPTYANGERIASVVNSMDGWFPGAMGIVRPEFCHRIAALFGGPSYSLWIRFKVTHPIRLVGWGWPKDVLERNRASLPSDEQYE